MREFLAAVSLIADPIVDASESDPVGRVRVPTVSEIMSRDAAIVRNGDQFGFDMQQVCHTDKFEVLGYKDVYASVLAHQRTGATRLLEIGIGVNDPSVPSGMAADHQVGASLVGWYHYFARAEIHGADIDVRTLIDTPYYETHFVDQRDRRALESLVQDLGVPIDVIIDDGLHTPEANGNTLAVLLPTLSPSGVMIVEDIVPEFDELWLGSQDWLPPAYAITYFPARALRQNRPVGYRGGMAVLTRKF